MCPPDCAQMDRVYREFLTLADGESMAIHCMHGLGRTGTALACIVGQTNNLSAPDAISFIRQTRPGSIESREQELFITQYLEGRVHDNY